MTAIEHLLANLYKNHYRDVGATGEMVRSEHRRMLDHLEADRWGDEPATADMLSHEFCSAVDAILAQIEDLMAEG